MNEPRPPRRHPDITEALAALIEDPAARPSPELTPAVDLVAALRATGTALQAHTSLPAQTRAAQRQRLMAVAHVQAVQATQTADSPAPPARAGLWSRLTGALPRFSARGAGVALAGSMASLVMVAGVGVAASRSLPGDPFYPVKRATESVQLRFAGSDLDRGELHLAIARTRLREVNGLVNGRDAFVSLGPVATGPHGLTALGESTDELVEETLEDMDSQTQDGVEVLLEVAREQQDTGPLKTIRRFADTQSAQLDALLPALPATARAQATSSLALVEQVQTQSTQLIEAGFCSADCNPVRALPTPQQTMPPSAPAPAATPSSGSTPTPTPTSCGCRPDEPEPTDEPSTFSPAPGKPLPLPTLPPQPTLPPLPLPTLPPLPLPTLPPLPLPTLPPLPLPTLPLLPSLLPLPLPLPTEIPLPQLPGLPLPTSLRLPDLSLPLLPGLPPLLGPAENP